MSSVLCNGAGEMPGHEGEGSCDEDLMSFIDSNEDDIITAYTENLTIDEVPDDFIQTYYENLREDNE